MPCSQNDSRTPSEIFAPGPIVAVERHAEILPELRAIGLTTLARIPSNTSIGMPPGLAAVFSISGGTAPISTAFATRLVPWRPM